MLRALLTVSFIALAFVIGRLSKMPEFVRLAPPDVQCVETVENVQVFVGPRSYFTPRARVRFTNGEIVWTHISLDLYDNYIRGEKLGRNYPSLAALVDKDTPTP